MEVRLIPFKDALAVLPADVVASRTEHDVEEEDHRDPRIVVLVARPQRHAARADRAAAERRGPLQVARGDRPPAAARDRALRGLRPALRDPPAKRAGGSTRSSASPAKAIPRVREHVWFEVRELKPGELRGVCLNEPVDGLPFHEGDEGWFKVDQLTDWLVVSPEGNFDPEAAPILPRGSREPRSPPCRGCSSRSSSPEDVAGAERSRFATLRRREPT